MFRSCSSLESVEIPSSVTSIGNYAFSGCHKLTNISIPNGVAEIGAYAFNECIKLSSVAIPNTVSIVGNNAFYMCSMNIYCEAESKPSGWEEDWDVRYTNSGEVVKHTVQWGYKETITN